MHPKTACDSPVGWRLVDGRGRSRRSQEAGQTLLESTLIIVLLSFIFFGMLQVALKVQAEQVQQWAAYASGRSRIVGFNDTVVDKAWVIANILNSGIMTTPDPGLSEVAQTGVEVEAIPLFLQSAGTVWELSPQLDYADWQRLPMPPTAIATDTYVADVQQNFPLRVAGMIPFLGASIGVTNVTLRSAVTFENHYPLYLQTE